MLSPTLIEKYVRHTASLMERDELIDRLVQTEQALVSCRDRVDKLEHVGRDRVL